MKRYLYLLFSLLLTGCGGGSGDSATAPAKVNTAPLLIGQLNMQLTATTSGESTFALQDAENDVLTVSYTDKPAWVEAVVSGNQLKLRALPGFLQVGTSKFSIRVSDGKTHSDYSIMLNVADDPTKWSQIAAVETDFIGQWSLSTGDDLHLYSDKTGRFFANDGNVYDLTWFDWNNSIQITSTKKHCVLLCQESIKAYFIASEGSKKRLVMESDTKNISMTMQPYTDKNLNNNKYLKEQLAISWLGSLQDNRLDVELPYVVKVANYSLHAAARISGQIDNAGKMQAQSAIDEVSLYLPEINGGRKYVDVIVNLTSVEVLPSATKRLTLKYQFDFILKDNSLNVDNFIGLKRLLETPYVGFAELTLAEKIDVPKIMLNTPYFSGFRLKTVIDGQEFAVGASEVIFTDSNTGVARFRKTDLSTVHERNFSWSVTQQQLTIRLDDKDYRYTFTRHPVHGVSLITEKQFLYPFLTNDKKFDARDLIKSYILEKETNSVWTRYHNIFADNIAELYTNEPRLVNANSRGYKWQQESDDSITLLQATDCDISMVFTSCADHLQRRLALGEDISIIYRNFKLIKKTDNNVYIQSSYSRKDRTSNEYFEVVERWISIEL